MQRFAERLNHPFPLGREPGAISVPRRRVISAAGRLYPPLVGGHRACCAGVRAPLWMAEYSIDAVCGARVLGRGRHVAGRRATTGGRLKEILHNSARSPQLSALWRTDARSLPERGTVNLVQITWARQPDDRYEPPIAFAACAFPHPSIFCMDRASSGWASLRRPCAPTIRAFMRKARRLIAGTRGTGYTARLGVSISRACTEHNPHLKIAPVVRGHPAPDRLIATAGAPFAARG